VGQAFIIADQNSKFSRIGARSRAIHILEIGVSCSEHDQLHSFACNHRDVVKKEIQSFLP